jgi:hypothetical protein
MAETDLKKGSYNRLWFVLSALAFKNGSATLKELTDLTGMPRSSTEDVLTKIVNGQVPELILFREKATFTVGEWGSFLSKKNLLNYYDKHCNNG